MIGHQATNLIDQTFNRLTVIGRASNTKSGNAQWTCRCECGKIKVVQSYKLRKGLIKSCGCYSSEQSRIRHKKYNRFITKGNITFCFDSKGRMFLVSTSSLDLVKNYYWSVSPRGYVYNTLNGIQLHRYLMKAPKGYVVDHKNHVHFDNRLSNLRVCSHIQNMQNSQRYKSNTSGVYRIGRKWRAKINVSTKEVHLGMFKSKSKAIKARKKAELKYYGEFTNHKK